MPKYKRPDKDRPKRVRKWTSENSKQHTYIDTNMQTERKNKQTG